MEETNQEKIKNFINKFVIIIKLKMNLKKILKKNEIKYLF